MNTLTLKDGSTEPFAWMIEGDTQKTDIEVVGAREWVIQTATMAADVTDSDLNEWMNSGELEEAVKFLNEWINE